MANEYQSSNVPKTVQQAAKKIAANAFMACILGIVVYMSILFVYRSVGSPRIIGYTKTVSTVNEDGTTKQTAKTYYFKDGEKAVVPENDETNIYSPIYTRDTFPEALSQILMLAVYALMLYGVAWDYGSHCHNKSLSDNTVGRDFRGVKMWAYSSFMYWISLIMMLFSKLVVEIPFTMPLYCLVNAVFLPLLNGFIYNKHGTYGLIAVFGNSPSDLSWLGVAVMLGVILVKLAICLLGFELGKRQISIREKIFYKNPNKN